MQGTHPKIVYHKEGHGTHALRFANFEKDEPPENHEGIWNEGTLISYHGLFHQYRDLFDSLMGHDFDAATMDIKDSEFKKALNKSKARALFPDIHMDTGSDGDGQGLPSYQCVLDTGYVSQ